ncbi:ATP-binding protein [Sneathiella limimaris]|uniref:ATP-binding protein n=1 Tax=Sneathiella limimaris TaxID=1964213 RepID=UPI00146F4CD4|nr:ATP-binding protein [Sneathiella limimaris]
MRDWIRSSIAYRQAKIALVAAVVVGVVFSLAQLSYELFEEREGTEKSVTHILNSMKDPAVTASYNLSNDLGMKVLNGIFQNPQIREGYLYATFSGGERELLARKDREISDKDISWLARLLFDDNKIYELPLSLSEETAPIGILQLRINPNYQLSNFLERAYVVLTVGFVRNMILAFVLVLIFYQTLTRPISLLAQKVRTINPLKPQEGLLDKPAGHETNELGVLVDGFNSSLTELGKTIHQLRQAEIEKADQLELFKSFARTSSDIFWQTEDDCKIILSYQDPKAEKLDTLISLNGASLFDLIAEHAMDLEETNLLSLKENPSDFRDIQLKFILNEAPLILSFDGTVRAFENGEFKGYLGTATDVTQSYLKDQEIADTQERLRQSQKMEAVGQLTGGIAHDFNNLLAVIMGNLEMLREQLEDNPAYLKMLDAALTSSEKGATLTQQLLAFSRKQSLNPTYINCNELVSEMVEMLKRTLGETVDIETDLDSSLIESYVDPAQFENALLNLAINARDSMSDGGHLKIKTQNYTLKRSIEGLAGMMPSGTYTEVTVADTGCGMDQETLEKAMEPFFTTKDVGKGSGMGLAMVYGFVAQSNGNIRIKSELGKGTEISLYLPSKSPNDYPRPSNEQTFTNTETLETSENIK